MKLCLLLAVGAFATQDVTPPVISLSLYGHHNAADLGAKTGEDWLAAAKAGSSASRACIVGSTTASKSCPNPTCHVTDHHDSGLQCDDADVQKINAFPKTASEAAATVSVTGGTEIIDRNELGQYLLTYRARDQSGNEADEIAFSFLFLDPLTPSLSFPANEANVGYTNEVKGWAHHLNSGCDLGVYKESCLAISHVENTWGYSFSSKRSVTSAVVHGEVWNTAENENYEDTNKGIVGTNAWAVTEPTTSVYASDNLESGLCGQAFGEATAHGCSRESDKPNFWLFDGSANTGDNYRDPSAMKVYMKVDTADWKEAQQHSFCMTNEPKYVVHWYVNDLAQDFGFKSASNPQVHRVQFDVTDNTKPRIHALAYKKSGYAAVPPNGNGADETTEVVQLECGKNAQGNLIDAYVEEGFEVTDNSDGTSCQAQNLAPVKCEAAGAPTEPEFGGSCGITHDIIEAPANNEAHSIDYSVTYTYTDKADNEAFKVTRPIKVVDTTVPQLDIKGDCTLENSAGANINADAGHPDADHADTGLFDKDRIADLFDHRDNCIYNIVTTVTIHTGGCQRSGSSSEGVSKCPGKASGLPITGNYLAQYTWKGEEGKWGQKNAGQQRFPEYEAGTYAIQYHTTDHKHEVFGCRQIENVDHTHPIIQILGSDVMTLEATHQGNYIDDGATCSDQVDGVISQNVEVSGDVVNLSKVGTYTITYNCKDSANNAAPPATRTVVVAQTSCPKCTVHGNPNVLHEASFPYTDAGASCSDVIDGAVTTHCQSDSPKWVASDLCEDLVDTETTGVYNIEYSAQNTVGLWNYGDNCRGGKNRYKRKVTVSDTLKPVITLRYNGAKVAQGSRDETGLESSKPNTKHEPAGDAQAPATNFGDIHNPDNFMAEETTSSVNGWVLGAIASAVAGLALLGYSTRRTAVATSVPV